MSLPETNEASQWELKRAVHRYLSGELLTALRGFLRPQGLYVAPVLTYLPESDSVRVVYEIPCNPVPGPVMNLDDAWVDNQLFFWKQRYKLVVSDESVEMVVENGQKTKVVCAFTLGNEGIFVAADRPAAAPAAPSPDPGCG